MDWQTIQAGGVLMPVEIFSKQAFEDALPKHKITNEPLWRFGGIVDGEYIYLLPIDAQTVITIRSSIDASGWSAESGQDSIRAWLVDCQDKPLGSKAQKWVTRVSGWDSRLREVLRQLWQLRIDSGNCPDCHEPMKIFKVRKAGLNKGRWFTSCATHRNVFKWLS